MDKCASQPTADGQSLLAKRTASEEPSGSTAAKRVKEPEPEPDAQAKARASSNPWRIPFPDKACAFLDRSLPTVAAATD